MILIVLSCAFLFGASVGVVAFANQPTKGAFTAAWAELQWDTKQKLQEQFDCCGLNGDSKNNTNETSPLGHPPCSESAILTSPGVRGGARGLGRGRGRESGCVEVRVVRRDGGHEEGVSVKVTVCGTWTIPSCMCG